MLDGAYAVNAPAEYAAVGSDPALARVVDRTGGRTFSADETAAIAEAVTRQTTHERTVERSWAWLFVAAALALYVPEVCVRRLRQYRGDGVIP